MKKPDRWDRMVQETSEKIGGFWSDTGADLLRKEHRWVERMVTKEKRELTLVAFKTRQSNDPRDIALADCLYARVSQCEEFLHRLQQRRK